MSSTAIYSIAKFTFTSWELIMKNDGFSDLANRVSALRSGERSPMIALKQVLLLTTGIFFITAPTPDSKDIADISANFIKCATLSTICPD